MIVNTYLLPFILVAVSVVGVAVSFFVFLANRPPNRLTWNVETASPLLSEGADSLDITYEGRRLQEPYVVEVSFRNVGRRSISASMFDQAHPIKFKFHVPILTLTGMMHHYGDVKVVEDELLIFPQLIRPGQSAKFTVLVDGKPDVSLESPLIDVNIRRPDNGYNAIRRSLYSKDVILLGVGTALTIVASIIVWIGR